MSDCNSRASIPFTKMHGAGNDYVYIDCFNHPEPDAPQSLAVAVADRHKGIGGDGLILICPDESADARMKMFNADGSESEMCGNGIRCVAKYLHDHQIVEKSELTIATGAGILALELGIKNGTVESVRVNMGAPILTPDRVPTQLRNSDSNDTPVVLQPLEVLDREFLVTCVSMGNPHCIIFVDEATDELVRRYGPAIENHEAFPNRVNVEFVELISSGEVRQRTWERGSGETMACGTGASAVCVAGVLAGKTDPVIQNHLLGGTLTLEWNREDNLVFMNGPATEVFSGVWPL